MGFYKIIIITALFSYISQFFRRCMEFPQIQLEDGVFKPKGGGGHCLFEGSYPLQNYRPCFSGLSTPQLSLTPLLLGVAEHHPLKSHFLNTEYIL